MKTEMLKMLWCWNTVLLLEEKEAGVLQRGRARVPAWEEWGGAQALPPYRAPFPGAAPESPKDPKDPKYPGWCCS